MFRRSNRDFSITSLAFLLSISVLILAGTARAQETGGELSGGIFRPKNPEAKHSTNPAKPKPNRPTRPNPAEVEEKFEDALAAGNDARDGRKFAAAEASYRSALSLKANDARAHYGLGNIFTDQQRWDDAEQSYRRAVDLASNNSEAMLALSYVL